MIMNACRIKNKHWIVEVQNLHIIEVRIMNL